MLQEMTNPTVPTALENCLPKGVLHAPNPSQERGEQSSFPLKADIGTLIASNVPPVLKEWLEKDLSQMERTSFVLIVLKTNSWMAVDLDHIIAI